MGLSIWHILVGVLVVFLLFGAGRVPKMMEDLAKGIKSFKKGLADDDAAQPVKRLEEDKQKDL